MFFFFHASHSLKTFLRDQVSKDQIQMSFENGGLQGMAVTAASTNVGKTNYNRLLKNVYLAATRPLVSNILLHLQFIYWNTHNSLFPN